MRLALVVAAVGCTQPPPARPTPSAHTPSCIDRATLPGLDVSTYQGAIDWAAVKAGGIEFAFIRLSHGIAEDKRFATNWVGAHDAGLVHGAYQFFRPTEDPIAQADLLLAKIGPLQRDELPPVLDIETADGQSPAQVVAGARLWVDRVTTALGRPPIIYTGFFFWRDNLGAAFDVAHAPLWHAQYTTEPCPRIPPPWTDWAFWQYTSKGRVAGIAGDVDLDRWHGDRASLDAFAGSIR